MANIALTTPLLSVALFIYQLFLRHEYINTKEDQLNSVYDFIVVGSGSAGAIVANRLADNGFTKVLCLEAGGPSGVSNDIPSLASSTTLFNSEYDWNYTMAKQPVGMAFLNEVIPEPRGFVVGGSSSFNTMIFNRGNRQSFDTWAHHFGARGWAYDEVLPYFMRYENNTDPLVVNKNPGFHGRNGPVQITSPSHPDPLMLIHQNIINRELGIANTDINGPQQRGTMLAQASIDRNGVRASASNAYIDPNPFPHNLHIITRALVTKILTFERKAIGVQFERNGITYNVFAKKEVIICAGSINSPKLLMLSGIGPKKHLEALGIPVLLELPVGDNLQNHPSTQFNFLIENKSLNLVNTGGQLTINQLDEWFRTGSGPLAFQYYSETYLNTRSNSDKEWPNVSVESAVYLFPQNITEFRSFRFGRLRDEWNEYLSNYLGKYYLLVIPLLQRVRSRGFVRLSSADPHQQPIINPNFLMNDQDFEDYVELIRKTLQFYELSSMAKHLEPLKPIPGCRFCADKRYIFECESYIICHIIQLTYSGYHPSGTCRMGSTERKDVVVDPLCRVKGMSSLRVCDASIMPLLPNANTNAAALMIGEKCAQIIKDTVI